jgi:ATP-binding cassette subfamily B protein/subfamily B ATP-binding cassette protein MsbA
MKNFGRALADARRYWLRLALATLCSAAAAGLWSANIAALFPILEVCLRGDSPQAWNQQRIALSEQRLATIEADLQAAENTATETASELASVSASRVQDLKMAQGSERVRIASAKQVQPWIEAYVPADPFHFLLLIVALLFTGTLAKQVMQVLANMVVARVSQDIARNIRHRVFDHTLSMDRATFLAQGPSGFSIQITQICDMLASGIQSTFGGAVSEPLKLIACMIGAAMISWRLLLASMLFAPFAAIAVVWLNRRLRGLAHRTLERSHSLYHVLHETLQNIATVQVFGMENQEMNRFRGATHELRRLVLTATFYNQLVAPVSELLAVSVVCLAIILGAHLFLHQQSSVFGMLLMDRPLGVSALTVFLGMLIGATEPVRRLSSVVAGINTGMVAADALYPMLERAPAIADPAEPRSPPRPHHAISFNEITFGYQPERPVLRNIRLHVPFGETIAIVGANGTGKSTLVNLLCRFYDPQRGTIELDGVPLTAMSRRELRQRIAVVAQHTELFNESLLYNIRYGNWEASDEQVMRAATLARAHEFIAAFPEQYQTLAGPNGMRLSGGQRQRIALARALLRDPEILILDEGTSQIDVQSEQLIHEALAAFKGTRTILLITHRDSALELADRIVRLQDGDIEILPAMTLAAA